MANSNGPFGLRPISRFDGSVYKGAVIRCKKEASVILAPGDPVIHGGNSEATPASGIPLVTRAVGSEGSPSASIFGVVVSRAQDTSALNKKHFAAADTGYVYVCPANGMYFEIQEDSVGGSLALTDVGRGADLIVANANTTLGISQVMLDSSTAADSGKQLVIDELLQRVDNAQGTYGKWKVHFAVPTMPATHTA